MLDGTPHPEADVDDSDTAQVLVIKPSLTLTKTVCDDLVRPGDQVTYTYRVTNTGDVGLQLINGGDDICAPITFVGGDTNHNGLVDGANSAAPRDLDLHLSADRSTRRSRTTPRVVGVDPLGNHYEATATASRRRAAVRDRAWTRRSATTWCWPAPPVTYTFTVTNTGESPVPANDVLSNVTLTDVSVPGRPGVRQPDLHRRATPTATAGSTGPRPGPTRAAAIIDETTNDMATVQGTDIKGGVVDAQDTARVTVFTPGIAVVKSVATRPAWRRAAASPTPTWSPTPATCRSGTSRARSPTTPAHRSRTSRATSTTTASSTPTRTSSRAAPTRPGSSRARRRSPRTPSTPSSSTGRRSTPTTSRCATRRHAPSTGSDVAKVVVDRAGAGRQRSPDEGAGLSPTGAQGIGLVWLGAVLLGVGRGAGGAGRRRPGRYRHFDWCHSGT